MAIKFYYSPQSTASVTATVFSELNHGRDKPLEERIVVNLREGGAKKPEYVANVNPNAQVPAIVLEDGTSVWESVAITIYLGETYGVEMGLWPKPGSKRGEALKWLVWANTTVSPKIGKVMHGDHSPAENKDEAVAAAKADVVSSVKLLDDALKSKEYITGEYSLADTHMYCFIWYARICGVNFDELANVTAWAERVANREQVKNAESD